jgi:hypothetical protein
LNNLGLIEDLGSEQITNIFKIGASKSRVGAQ